ncbi:disintegrin and metalloproteinase domain-containing protein 9-like isoform A [Alligator mississippiensis]|uniref:Disintegrin and metalloproteinase domain-containing protein 9-like isoform A n=1 Tax=Alligator mississippiensis TaxID=8496 RepID=A0A151NLX4_ALLMI|nr:disintegrin and metalloproteinase domain-containing protein 9-like isoform A [Alligator mississippiensis]
MVITVSPRGLLLLVLVALAMSSCPGAGAGNWGCANYRGYCRAVCYPQENPVGPKDCAEGLVCCISGISETTKFSYSEVIVPRKLEAEVDGSKEAVSYVIKIEGHYYGVHLLRKKMYVARNFPVFTYNTRGDLITDYPYIQDDCFYTGYVEDVPGSVAVLSTCSGLWGYLKIYGVDYEIEPVASSSSFQHLLYRAALEEDSPERCGVIDEDMRDPAAEHRDPPTVERQLGKDGDEVNLLYTSTRYLELYLIADKAKFLHENANETLLTRKMLQYVHLMNYMFHPFGLRVSLVGVEIWTERDITAITPHLNQVLELFADYAHRVLQHRLHFDLAELMVGGSYPGLFGLSLGESLCKHHPSVAVVKAASRSVLYDALSMAHETGHSLGFTHDNAKANVSRSCYCNCTCGGRCIMSSTNSLCTGFSNCTRAEYYNLISKQSKRCLLDISQAKRPKPESKCGDGVVGEAEECDCGSHTEKCCQSNCLRKPGARCVFGHCCKQCQFLKEGRLCRESSGECDLPEFCNGTSELCPEDMIKQDGTPCSDSYLCFQGKCRKHKIQCKVLFGQEAEKAPAFCYETVNTKGDRTGHCGRDGMFFKKCKKSDVMCGKLQCTNIKYIPDTDKPITVVQDTHEDYVCWTAILKDDMDVGTVQDGTACDRDKMCLNRTCVNITHLNYNCNPTKCNNRGVCNSNKNCHCDHGWAPPDCKFKGYGGSIDSGPITEHSDKDEDIAVEIVIGVSITVLALIAVITHRTRQSTCKRQN